MEKRLLELFLCLADTLHFGRASQLSHISPSALSRAISQLEESVGVTLFDRDNRSVALTSEGRVFVDYARETLDQWEVMRHSLMAQSQELSGEISMYCSVTASYSFLYDILSEFRQQYPQIEIKLHTGDPDDAMARVMASDEDIAIAAKPEKIPTGGEFKPIAESTLVFIQPSSFGKGNSEQRSVTDWAQTPMILSEQGVARQRVNRWFKALGIKPRIYAQVAGNEAIVSMVSLGFGVGVVPKIVLDNSPLRDSVTIIEDAPDFGAYQVGVFALKKKLQSPLIKAFWAQLR